MRRAIPILLVLTLAAAPALGRNVGYRIEFVGNIGCHVVQVDLSSPWAKVTPITSLRFPGGAEPMMKMCGRLHPTAAITGTFFSKTSLLPIGDIVRDGRLVHFGGMGTAIAITPENIVAFEDVEYGRHQDWGPFETVLACGPRLLRSGRVSLAPRHQGFSDPHVLGRASRVAVGLTPDNKLLMVVTRQDISLTQLAKLMLSLGCIDAVNLDGGGSTGMYYRGKGVVMPGRSLVNMLAVYESVEHEARTCNCELPAEREAIYQWRSARAYQVYMQAQNPLAQGDLDEAIRLLEKAAGLDELNASYQARLAGTLAARGDLTAASAAHSRAGVILADKNLLGEATEHMRKALDYNPDNPIAQTRLPSLYREQGMEREARAAEYSLKLRELEESVVAAHTDLMSDIVAQAWALAGGSVAEAGHQPRLAEIFGMGIYVDGELGVALQPPMGWEVAPGADPGALVMRHRFEPLLAHLRVIRVPERLDMDRLTELYYARSFQHELLSLPAVRETVRVTRATEVVSLGDRLYCETLFSRRGELVWILSFTCSADLHDRAVPDIEAIIEGFTLFR
jgi:tetratricopeptide (TPR) repeat protein